MEFTYEEVAKIVKKIYTFELLDEIDTIELLMDILNNNPDEVVEI